ncbi:hypothetical protein HanRHA438_Chr01g0045361 [Helianthus annuus]|nr:hypothetical protein HanRHA438_Chr01g0045361 [Helianthus annuus]
MFNLLYLMFTLLHNIQIPFYVDLCYMVSCNTLLLPLEMKAVG